MKKVLDILHKIAIGGLLCVVVYGVVGSFFSVSSLQKQIRFEKKKVFFNLIKRQNLNNDNIFPLSIYNENIAF